MATSAYNGGPGGPAGNINLTNGQTAFSIAAGDLLSQAKQGDLLVVDGETSIGFVASIATMTSGELQFPWDGPTITQGQGSPPKWSIRHIGAEWNSNVPTNEGIAELLEHIRAGGNLWEVDGPPDAALGRVGDFAINIAGSSAIIYSKTGLGWGGGTVLVGNSVRIFTSAPSNGVGVDGDVGIRTDTGGIYQKQAGAWVLISVVTGAQGPRGAAPTIVFTLDTGSTSGAGIASGEVRFSNADIGTLNQTLFFSTLQNNGGSVAAILDTWDDRGSTTDRGFLYGYNPADPTKWVAYQVTGSVVTQTGRREVSGTRLASNPATGAIGVDASSLAWQFAPTGLKGDQGIPGVTPGKRFAWLIDVANSDPGAGKVKADNAIFSSITLLRINDTDASGANIEDWIQSLSASTSPTDRGRIELRDATAGVANMAFVVTGNVIDRTGWWDVPVSPAGGVILPDQLGVAVNFAATGAGGQQGVPGADGTDPGILYTWDDGNDDANPDTGNIRADNDDLSLATFFYVSVTNRSGNDVEAALIAMGGSTNAIKGSLTLTRATDEAQAVFDVTVVAAQVGYVRFAVTNHSGANGFVLGNPISLQFARAGDEGIAGGAPLDSPDFTGTPSAPTPPVEDNSISIATTEFVARANAATFHYLFGGL